MCGLDGAVVVYTEAGHVFSRCVTTHYPLKNAELNVSRATWRELQQGEPPDLHKDRLVDPSIP